MLQALHHGECLIIYNLENRYHLVFIRELFHYIAKYDLITLITSVENTTQADMTKGEPVIGIKFRHF
jgi:hypothetical protein